MLPTSVGFAAVSTAGGDVCELEKLLAQSRRVAGDPEKAWSELIALSPVLRSIRINGSLLSFILFLLAVWLAQGLRLSPVVVEG